MLTKIIQLACAIATPALYLGTIVVSCAVQADRQRSARNKLCVSALPYLFVLVFAVAVEIAYRRFEVLTIATNFLFFAWFTAGLMWCAKKEWSA